MTDPAAAPADPSPRLLRLLADLDDVFDTWRNAALFNLMPRVFETLARHAPGCLFFTRIALPDYAHREDGDLVATTDVLYLSDESRGELVRRLTASLPASPLDAEVQRVAGGIAVPLRRRGGFFGWIGGIPEPGAPSEWLSALLETAALRVDSEVEMHIGRLRRRILAAKLNRALEDYYLDRGVRRALNLLLINGVCDGVYLLYDRSGLDGAPDVVSQHHSVWGVQDLPLTPAALIQFRTAPTELPERVRDRIAGLKEGLTVPLCRRDFDGQRRAFGIIIFTGPGLDFSARMVLEEFANDLDSAVINYHEKRRELSRFLSPQLVSQLLEGDRADIERRVAPRQQLLALGFADIVGYSKLCSKYPDKAHQIATLLRDWKREMRDAAFRRDGVVDKFIGDCIFYHCGAWTQALPEKLALDAVAIALDCVAATEKLRRRMADYGFAAEDDLRLSTGIHVGANLVVGEIGGEFTAIGSDVNVAARIQDHERASGRILVSRAVRDLIEPALVQLQEEERRVTLGAPATIELKGVGGIEVYEVITATA